MAEWEQRESYPVPGCDDGAMKSDRLSVAEWIEDLSGPGEVASECILDLRHFLDVRAAEVSSRLAPGLLPLRLPKSRLTSLDRCERMALAEALATGEDGPLTPERFRGAALDHLVAHQLVAGRVLDAPEVLRGMLAADGEVELLDYMDQLDADDESQLGDILQPLATAVAEGWAGIEPSWLARTQSRATAVFNHGDVVCSGRLDVELGGAPTGRPGVVVEIKSGQPRAEHVAEMYYYALLVALRDGQAPAAMLRWYPGAAPAIAPVSEGVLNSVAVRIADAMELWAALVGSASASSAGESAAAVAGIPATESVAVDGIGATAAAETPGAWCMWCPEADVCPSAFADRS